MPEIQWMIGPIFFEVSYWTFVASGFKILFLQCLDIFGPVFSHSEYDGKSYNALMWS